MAASYIVIFQQVVCSPGMPITIDYSWDSRKYNSRSEAITHGFEIRGSDDFNIGIVERGRLVGFSWMDESIPDDLAAIACMIGLKA